MATLVENNLAHMRRAIATALAGITGRNPDEMERAILVQLTKGDRNQLVTTYLGAGVPGVDMASMMGDHNYIVCRVCGQQAVREYCRSGWSEWIPMCRDIGHGPPLAGTAYEFRSIESASETRKMEAKQIEPDDVEKLILKWRDQAAALRRLWAGVEQNSRLAATCETLVKVYNRCANELELAYIGPDPVGSGVDP